LCLKGQQCTLQSPQNGDADRTVSGDLASTHGVQEISQQIDGLLAFAAIHQVNVSVSDLPSNALLAWTRRGWMHGDPVQVGR
jgi:hypothetical protein